ncbi:MULTISPECIES: SDR family oxidoreductase [Streptomyces]|uniref:NAD(P)H-binding protein n=1 Tax=Streptomyces tendae TaxID=1932 RepID=A0A6B3QW98_STRTE|nr:MULTISPECIES: NAD(P)H-binding protein [Streptomyces]MBQ0966687.1 NAD(P)H-binding protein [Streptomyces sp. RK74B]MBQ1007030.1 NAD(P)H-binding protein [Streptomyces sp. RK23]NEV92336.1 NAD(P)H-binding protein [Streptomyces tendae]
MRVAVAGGTGLVGKYVVGELRAAGHTPVVLARSHGVDLTTGAGLAEKLSGSDAVIDVANIVTTRRKTAVDFFSRTTGNLIAAARAGGIAHLVTLSIVGSDEVDFGYYFGKRAQEELVRDGDVPWTVLRATQFFEFPEPLLNSASPVVMVPRMLTRPVAAQDVAETLVAYALGDPAGMAPEIAGPDQLDMVDMARRIARARGRRRLVVPVTLPGKVGKAMTTGGLLPRGEYLRGRRTFEARLASLRAA